MDSEKYETLHVCNDDNERIEKPINNVITIRAQPL